MLERAYIEITNVCNLFCSFCPKTRREASFMSVEDFTLYARKLRAYTDCFCLHVMGEPLLHSRLDAILSVCDVLRARVILTTNGTMLRERGDILLAHPSVYKVQISLHSFEANGASSSGSYFTDCFDFARRSSERGIITVLRLWNIDGREEGYNDKNDEILKRLRDTFSGFWAPNKRGYCIREKLYLEYDERFVWPAPDGKILSESGRCHAIGKQIAVLCDGTVVPCCLDREGVIRLGDLKRDDVDTVLSCPRAKAMTKGFEESGAFSEVLCKTCGYADRFRR
ncbi:MAG: radical SAM/SPASM domain-containing protein [Clostridia bacterium]|nr:radical SAM/SPASM domain-containing protein [Clostridia bacterium]